MVDRNIHDSDEIGRISALRRLQVLDTGREPEFDRITALLRTVLGVAATAVSLLDQNRLWVKSSAGPFPDELPRRFAPCDFTIRSPDPLVIPDLTDDPRSADHPIVTAAGGLRAYAGIPLVMPDGYVVGTLCAVHDAPRDFSPHDVDLLRSFADLVIDQLELRMIAMRDELTGAATRRALIDQATREVAGYRRHRTPATLILFDIDRFRRVNNAYGHVRGDDMLRAVAQVCQSELRSGDLFARVGGEEFAALLPGTPIFRGLAIAERIRRDILAMPPAFPDAPPVTASFGVAALGGSCANWTEWYTTADAALDAAKRGGRNRCWRAGDLEESAA